MGIGPVCTEVYHLAVRLPVFKTRFIALWNVLHPDHFVFILILSVLGILCSWCLTELLGYANGMWHLCEINGLVFNSACD